MKFIDKIKSGKNGESVSFIYIILIIGILVRIIGISHMPNALNCDEASDGYEAFSILNYGIDRMGIDYLHF